MQFKEIIHDNSDVIFRPQSVRVLSGFDFLKELVQVFCHKTILSTLLQSMRRLFSLGPSLLVSLTIRNTETYVHCIEIRGVNKVN